MADLPKIGDNVDGDLPKSSKAQEDAAQDVESESVKKKPEAADEVSDLDTSDDDFFDSFDSIRSEIHNEELAKKTPSKAQEPKPSKAKRSRPSRAKEQSSDDEDESSKKRVYTMLENNPTVMSEAAYALGMSKDLAFYDVWSFDSEDLVGHIPRPVYALLCTIPMSKNWGTSLANEDRWYTQNKRPLLLGEEEPAFFIKQTIEGSCGFVGLLHCLANLTLKNNWRDGLLVPDSPIMKFLSEAMRAKPKQRAELLGADDRMYEINEAFAREGDSVRVKKGSERTGNHFVAFVKGQDGHLHELEGRRKGPMDRGKLGDDDDMVSPKALEEGIRRIMGMHSGEESVSQRYSCIALAPKATR